MYSFSSPGPSWYAGMSIWIALGSTVSTAPSAVASVRAARDALVFGSEERSLPHPKRYSEETTPISAAPVRGRVYIHAHVPTPPRDVNLASDGHFSYAVRSRRGELASLYKSVAVSRRPRPAIRHRVPEWSRTLALALPRRNYRAQGRTSLSR